MSTILLSKAAIWLRCSIYARNVPTLLTTGGIGCAMEIGSGSSNIFPRLSCAALWFCGPELCSRRSTGTGMHHSPSDVLSRRASVLISSSC